ncbi:MAG: hypothetical protein ACKVOL_02765 [Novosphingobium sp.]
MARDFNMLDKPSQPVILTESGLGDWAFGRLMLNQLLPEPLPVAQGLARGLPAVRTEVQLRWHLA